MQTKLSDIVNKVSAKTGLPPKVVEKEIIRYFDNVKKAADELKKIEIYTPFGSFSVNLVLILRTVESNLKKMEDYQNEIDSGVGEARRKSLEHKIEVIKEANIKYLEVYAKKKEILKSTKTKLRLETSYRLDPSKKNKIKHI